MTAAFARRSPAAVVLALATVYLVWGSTYLAIRVTDRTLPPLLMSSVRFLIAGVALYAFASRGRARDSVRRIDSSALRSASETGVRSDFVSTLKSVARKRDMVMESAVSARTWARRRSSS